MDGHAWGVWQAEAFTSNTPNANDCTTSVPANIWQSEQQGVFGSTKL